MATKPEERLSSIIDMLENEEYNVFAEAMTAKIDEYIEDRAWHEFNKLQQAAKKHASSINTNKLENKE